MAGDNIYQPPASGGQYGQTPPAGGGSFGAINQMVLTDLNKWMKFVGTVMLILGILYSLPIITLIISWVPILLGIKLRKSAEALTLWQSNNSDINALNTGLGELKTFFLINGVLMIISLGFLVLYMIAIIALLATGTFDEIFSEIQY